MPRQSGFTLIETLVAFAILALSCAVLLPLVRESADKTEDASLSRAATSIAESRLNEVSSVQYLKSSETSGIDGAFHWSVRVNRTSDLPADNPYRLASYEVIVSVSWLEQGRNRSIALQTLRLGMAS